DRNSQLGARLGDAASAGYSRQGCQFRIRVIGEAACSSATRLTRNRWPSEDTAYCCLFVVPGRGPPAMRTGNRTAGVQLSSDWPSADNFTGATIILLSNDT